MPTLNNTLLSKDLDHIISQRSTSITGVLPASIKDVVFTATNTLLEELEEVEIAGTYQKINAELTINATKYTNLPSIGAVLRDGSGRQYKVLNIENDDPDNPIELKLQCDRRHTNA